MKRVATQALFSYILQPKQFLFLYPCYKAHPSRFPLFHDATKRESIENKDIIY
jgi:hypothetical protein